jgi:DMSO/TMAO reductase YedYZ molybdopterin-dependent catalytic subunit
LIANVEWRGVLLREILALARVEPSCRYIWAYGLDHGTFYSSPHQEHYVKDLPLDYVMKHDVIVATHLNGEPLSPKHGFPARIVAPGYYGTNSVKWLCRVEAANRRANGHFTRELHNRLQRTATDIVPRHERRSAAAEPGRSADSWKVLGK